MCNTLLKNYVFETNIGLFVKETALKLQVTSKFLIFLKF